MLIVYFALFALSFYKCKFAGKNFFTEECLSRDVTNSIKGIFIWLVFLNHFAGYVTYTAAIDFRGLHISKLLGQLIVTCFLFYSGYGIGESIKKHGQNYIKALPKNRLAKTLIHFDFAVLLYLIIRLVFRQKITLKTTLLSFIGWESLGNSNWYIFVILALYLFTWIAFSLIKNNIRNAAFLVSGLTVGLIIFLYFTKEKRYWHDTALCYVLGLWLSIYKERLLKFITKNNRMWILSTGFITILFVILCITPITPRLFFTKLFLQAPVFCLLITALLIKIKISNKLLIFSGQHLFEIYILQRIPMIIFKKIGLANINIYLYFAVCLIVTILLAVVFRFLFNKLDSVIFKTKSA